jgi:hypothetical protein
MASLSWSSRQARCAFCTALQEQGRTHRCRKCWGAGPGGDTSRTSQTKQCTRRPGTARLELLGDTSSDSARTTDAICHPNSGGNERCWGARREAATRENGKNQKAWSKAVRAPQKPTASGHAAGQPSSTQERRTRSCVCFPTPNSAPHRNTKYVCQTVFLSLPVGRQFVVHMRFAKSCGGKKEHNSSTSSTVSRSGACCDAMGACRPNQARASEGWGVSTAVGTEEAFVSPSSGAASQTVGSPSG